MGIQKPVYQHQDQNFQHRHEGFPSLRIRDPEDHRPLHQEDPDILQRLSEKDTKDSLTQRHKKPRTVTGNKGEATETGDAAS